MKCTTLSQMHIFQGGDWGRESECVVISQFAQEAEECIGLLDITPLSCSAPRSGSWQLDAPSRKEEL